MIDEQLRNRIVAALGDTRDSEDVTVRSGDLRALLLGLEEATEEFDLIHVIEKNESNPSEYFWQARRLSDNVVTGLFTESRFATNWCEKHSHIAHVAANDFDELVAQIEMMEGVIGETVA